MRARVDPDGSFDPIERLIEEALGALKSNMFMVSLISSLTLIDICGALDSDDGEARGKRFKAWFDANGPADYLLDADDAYQLRCGLLHQGHTRGEAYDLIVFTLPVENGTVIRQGVYSNIGGDPRRVLSMDLRIFITEVLKAVGVWWATNKHREPVATNAQALAQVRSEGLPPYYVGLPVIG